MVTWTCDRCEKRYSDGGLRTSCLPESWGAFYLAEVKETEEILDSRHLCDHCVMLPLTKVRMEITK